MTPLLLTVALIVPTGAAAADDEVTLPSGWTREVVLDQTTLGPLAMGMTRHDDGEFIMVTQAVSRQSPVVVRAFDSGGAARDIGWEAPVGVPGIVPFWLETDASGTLYGLSTETLADSSWRYVVAALDPASEDPRVLPIETSAHLTVPSFDVSASGDVVIVQRNPYDSTTAIVYLEHGAAAPVEVAQPPGMMTLAVAAGPAGGLSAVMYSRERGRVEAWQYGASATSWEPLGVDGVDFQLPGRNGGVWQLETTATGGLVIAGAGSVIGYDAVSDEWSSIGEYEEGSTRLGPQGVEVGDDGSVYVLVMTFDVNPGPPRLLRFVPPGTPVLAQDASWVVPADRSTDLLLSGGGGTGALSFSVADGPDHGTLSGEAPDLTYAPAPGYSGPDELTFEVTDSTGRSATGTVSITVSATGEESVAQEVPAGGTVSTGLVDADDPAQATVTTPVAGEVSIARVRDPDPVAGYALVGSQYEIEAPDATVEEPLRLAFEVDEAELPAGQSAGSVTVFRDGAPIGPCADGSGAATPDPCVAERSTDAGVVRIVVLSSHASTWTLGVRLGRMALEPKRVSLVASVLAGGFTFSTVVRDEATGKPVAGAHVRFAAKPLLGHTFGCTAVSDARGVASCVNKSGLGILSSLYPAKYDAAATHPAYQAATATGRMGL